MRVPQILAWRLNYDRFRKMRTRLCLLVLLALAAASPLGAQQILRWGGDAEGGAPFVEADPRDPSKLVGFDVEIAELIARKLGRTPQFLQVQFTSLDQSAKRGDFDIGLSGIEDIPARRQSLAASIPYYEFREVLTVRDGDRGRYRSLADLKGKRVATLGGTMAYDLLLDAERTHGITAVSYDDDVHPYSDLAARPGGRGRARQRPRRSRDAPQRRPVHTSRRAGRRPLHRHHRAREHRAARPGRRDPARGDARRHARSHLPEMECLE